MERRYSQGSVTADDNFIVGLAAEFNNPYPIIGTPFKEIISDKAFDKLLARKHDVKGLYDHREERLLGRVSSGTLQLTKTDKGIEYKIPYDAQDEDHRYVRNKIRKGDAQGSSFSFLPADIQWKSEDTYVVTDIKDWGDVGPVVTGMNPRTYTAMRSADQIKDLEESLDTWKRHEAVKKLMGKE